MIQIHHWLIYESDSSDADSQYTVYDNLLAVSLQLLWYDNVYLYFMNLSHYFSLSSFL